MRFFTSLRFVLNDRKLSSVLGGSGDEKALLSHLLNLPLNVINCHSE